MPPRLRRLDGPFVDGDEGVDFLHYWVYASFWYNFSVAVS